MYVIWVYTFDGNKGPVPEFFQEEWIAYQALQALMLRPDRPRFGWVTKVEIDNGVSG